MSIKHTPGPWAATVETNTFGGWKAAEQQVTIHADGWMIAHYSTASSEFPNDEANKANARLLAAAPDLLEACRVGSALLKGLPRSLGYDLDVRQLDYAIAKATGATP